MSPAHSLIPVYTAYSQSNQGVGAFTEPALEEQSTALPPARLSCLFLSLRMKPYVFLPHTGQNTWDLKPF